MTTLTVGLMMSCPTARDAVASQLDDQGWTSRVISSDPDQAVEELAHMSGFVADFGLLCGEEDWQDHASSEVSGVGTTVSVRVCEARRQEEPLAIVMLTSRENLGSVASPRRAALAAGVIATARSLALRYASRGITVNALSLIEPAQVSGGRPVNPLLPYEIDTVHVARPIGFLLDRRSRYITGQTLYVCGGASLVSSHSV